MPLSRVRGQGTWFLAPLQLHAPAPGAAPDRIVLHFEGADTVEVDPQGWPQREGF